MSHRTYKTGAAWCLWRWTFTPSNYITRLHILKTPWFAVVLHWINARDAEPHLHDHPVTFLSLILRGGYVEERGTARRLHVRRWWNFIRATPNDSHRIITVEPYTLTLCLMGPKTREWGFHTHGGWVYWRSYNRRVYR